MSFGGRIKVIIIEPSPVVRRGLQTIIEEHEPRLRVVGAWADIREFDKSGFDEEFEIALINPAAAHFFHRFNIREMFEGHNEAALAAIIYGYVDGETLGSFDGVVDIYDSGERIARKVHKIAAESLPVADPSPSLSEREREILVSIARGFTNKEIADRHSISVHTVVSHRKNITRKTGIKTASGLTVYAIFNNLVSQDEL